MSEKEKSEFSEEELELINQVFDESGKKSHAWEEREKDGEDTKLTNFKATWPK